RPANGADLQIMIHDIILPRAGKYPFRAVYTTSKPEILTSAGTGAETATLTAVQTISDFERVLDKELQYKESPTTYTTVNFKWGASGNASNIELMQSLDKGKSWLPARAVINLKKATANVSGLTPNKLYTFRLAVKNGAYKGLSNTVS